MASENLFTRLFAPADRRVTVKSGVAVKTIIPRSARGLPFRGVQRLTMPMIEKRFVDACKAAKPDVVAFLWGDISLSAASALRDAGVFVAREKFNCAKAVSRRIVQDAYSKLGAPSAFRHQAYSPEIIDIEQRQRQRTPVTLSARIRAQARCRARGD